MKLRKYRITLLTIKGYDVITIFANNESDAMNRIYMNNRGIEKIITISETN